MTTNAPDIAKVRREHMRWVVLLALNNARPLGAMESVVLAVVQAVYPDASPLELRKELDYLSDRELIKLVKRPDGPWHADLTRFGVDVVEYTVDCQPGIARPAKYW